MRSCMPQTILVPAGFTPTSNVALKERASVAEGCAAERIVLYADQFFSPPDAGIEAPHKFLDMSDHDKTEAVRTYLRQKLDAVVPRRVPGNPIVMIDSTVDAILTVAKEKGVDDTPGPCGQRLCEADHLARYVSLAHDGDGGIIEHRIPLLTSMNVRCAPPLLLGALRT